MNILSFCKKGLASIALAAMTFMVAPVSQAYLGFTDESQIPSWAEEAIEELMDQGVLSGNDDGSFAPNRQLNRAEVAKIIVLASGVPFDTYGGPHFPDVNEDAWFYDYVETMYNYGWIDGYPDGYFRPSNGINRVELAKMIVNSFEIDLDTTGAPHFSDVNPGDWFYAYVETAYNYGLMTGYSDGSFGPANPVTRAETARITYDAQLVVASPTGPAEGTLEVMLSDDTPRGTNVPYNATSVPYTTVEFTASDDSDVEISSMTITRLGLGDNEDFNSVWMEIDGFKVGNDKSINNDDIAQLRFNPPIVVPAGQTLMADIVASAKYTIGDTNVGHHNRIAVVSADDLATSAANVVGDFPIEGEEMQVADYKVSELTFTDLGSDTTIDVGDNFIEIGKFRMLNASTTNKDVELRAMTFKNDGTAEVEDILENVALYVSGEQVSAETIIDGDYVTFRLDNGVTGGYVIEDGDSRIFSIRADIVSAEKSDTIEFKVDNYEDIVAIEIGTSFGVKTISSSYNEIG
ncbi:MAG: S-layer homology domain-containing protein, partial [Candidatus Gracilibacteria bacterium]|nr:S-layer homology domain-containing protein [Candidatus Gracilibacteria bacterium]